MTEENTAVLYWLSRIRQKQFILLLQLFHDAQDENDIEEYEEFCFQLLSLQMKEIPARIQDFLQTVVPEYSDTEFRENFRVSRHAFHIILQKMVQVYAGDEPFAIERALLAVIWLLATPDSYRSVGSRLNMAKSSLNRDFIKIINGINQIAFSFIRWPTVREMQQSKEIFSNRYGEIFNAVIGAIDGIYVPIKVPAAQQLVYTNRKKFTGMTLQVISNEDMLFTDCFTGYPSSVSDIRVFRNSPLYLRVQEAPQDFFPNGEVILGDNAYPALFWLQVPFINRGNLNRNQVEFNRQHSSARSVVERSFAHFFGRWRRLRDLDMNRLDWVPATIMAACVLHNVCILSKDNIDRYIEEGLPIARQNAIHLPD